MLHHHSSEKQKKKQKKTNGRKTVTDNPTCILISNIAHSDFSCSVALIGKCGQPSHCWSQGSNPLCDRGRGQRQQVLGGQSQGERRPVSGPSGPSCRASARWLAAGSWSIAACWRSHWPANCTAETWSALCCSRGSSFSLEQKGRQWEG